MSMKTQFAVETGEQEKVYIKSQKSDSKHLHQVQLNE